MEFVGISFYSWQKFVLEGSVMCGAMSKQKKNFSLEFWRTLSTCLIILYHYEPVSGSRENFLCCYLCVEFFFILSGFLMAMHLETDIESSPTKAAAKYLLRRYRQLYPAFLISWFLVLCKIIFFNHEKIRLLFAVREHVWELSLLWILIPNCKTYIFYSWYISAMFVASYFIYWLIKSKKVFFLGFIAPLLVILIYSFFSKFDVGLYRMHYQQRIIIMDGVLRAFAGMSVGCVSFYLYKFFLRFCSGGMVQKICFSSFEIIVLRFLYSILIRNKSGNYDFLSIPMFAFLIILEFGQFTILSNLLNRRIFLVFGYSCLGAYLNQGWIRDFLIMFSQKHSMRFWKSSLLLLFACMAFGFLLHWFIKEVEKILFLIIKKSKDNRIMAAENI